MTEDYNSGKWIGWHGGERPVHPNTVVEYITATDGPFRRESAYGEVEALRLSWVYDDEWIVVAFRVVKEYREPRECWAVGNHMRDSLADAEAFRARVDAANPGHGRVDTPITHWREVVD